MSKKSSRVQSSAFACAKSRKACPDDRHAHSPMNSPRSRQMRYEQAGFGMPACSSFEMGPLLSFGGRQLANA